jgi:hypothetical protein
VIFFIFIKVPRTFHNGIKGTFMNLDTHNKYFRDIAFNTNELVIWNKQENHAVATDEMKISASSYGHTGDNLFGQAISDMYESRIRELINRCIHVNSVIQLADFSGSWFKFSWRIDDTNWTHMYFFSNYITRRNNLLMD